MAEGSTTDPSQRSGTLVRWIAALLVVGCVVCIVLGISLALVGVSAEAANAGAVGPASKTFDCGSAIRPIGYPELNLQAGGPLQPTFDPKAACDDVIHTRRIAAIWLVAGGILLAIGANVVWSRRARPQSDPEHEPDAA